MDSKLILCIPLLVLMITACSMKETVQVKQDKAASPYPNIPNPEIKIHNTYSIAMPIDWREAAAGLMVTYVPKESEAADPLSEKVVVIVSIKSDEEARIPLKEMVDNGMNGIKSMLPDIALISEDETAKLDDLDAIRFIYTATIQGKLIEYSQISAKKNNIVYGIMHSCIKGSCRYNGVYDDMVSSFKTIDYIPPKQ
jgi:hypothetical protein